jgi:hypothetical protein
MIMREPALALFSDPEPEKVLSTEMAAQYHPFAAFPSNRRRILGFL